MCAEKTLACLEKVVSQLSSSLQRAIDIFFQFFVLKRQKKENDRRHSCRDRKFLCVTFVYLFPSDGIITLDMNKNRSFINRNQQVQCRRRKIHGHWILIKRVERGSREKRELN